MLRSSHALTALLAALTTLVAVLAHSQPRPADTNAVKPQTGKETLSDATLPVCYIQLENGQLRDLGRLCGKRSTRAAPLRALQRSIAQPNLEVDDDDSAPGATPKPSSTSPRPTSSSTPSPTKSTPQTTVSPSPVSPSPVSPSPSPLGKPLSPLPANPSIAAPTSHPLAIPEDQPSRN